ncbi:MAG: rhomboid family intramembrane serine protease [Mycoplasmatota bacterium]
MKELRLSKSDELVMRLLHYFITKQNYNPIVLHGAKNEIWLENLNNDIKIIRIVSNYIHNDEQLKYDYLRSNQIIKQIKKKTFSYKVNTLNLFVNLGENVTNENVIRLNEFSDISKYKELVDDFPDIEKKPENSEEGFSLFTKIMDEINQKNVDDAKKADDLFKPKKPIMTYALIAVNVLIFLYMFFVDSNLEANTLYKFGGVTGITLASGEYYRVFTCMFLHSGIFHLFLNMYALYILGPQIETLFGKKKFLAIYIGSGLIASLMSILFLPDYTVSVGASGAIFGLLSSLVYFGYFYRVYLGTVIKNQILPIIFINLAISFMFTGIDAFAHLGGLLGGVLITMAAGVPYKSTNAQKINGLIMSCILILFLYFLGISG